MRIGIIGAGFTGTMLAVQILRAARSPVEIVLIDGGQNPGRGVAYGTDNPDHLLNVRASNMSAFENDPSHFLRWLWAEGEKHGIRADIPPSGQAFVSRKIYGTYITSIFRDAVKEAPANSTVSIINNAATAFHDGRRPAVTLSDRRLLYVDRLALCIGNFPPAPPPGFGAAALSSERYVSDPWAEGRLRAVRGGDEVLILGSGLTMIDVVQTLVGLRHTGRIHVVSRRGLVPHRHQPVRPYKMDQPRGSLLDILRRVRREIKNAAPEYGWRDVMDALRPSVTSIWQGLTNKERGQFLRHLRPYWDIHRHRLAPLVADNLKKLREAGQVKTGAGRIRAVTLDNDHFSVAIQPRDQGEVLHLSPSWIINCSGPHCDYGRVEDPFIQSLGATGIVRLDTLRLGFEVTHENAVVGVNGKASTNIVAVGPPSRGAFWECTAVPDIRAACARVAATLLQAAI